MLNREKSSVHDVVCGWSLKIFWMKSCCCCFWVWQLDYTQAFTETVSWRRYILYKHHVFNRSLFSLFHVITGGHKTCHQDYFFNRFAPPEIHHCFGRRRLCGIQFPFFIFKAVSGTKIGSAMEKKLLHFSFVSKTIFEKKQNCKMTFFFFPTSVPPQIFTAIEVLKIKIETCKRKIGCGSFKITISFISSVEQEIVFKFF